MRVSRHLRILLLVAVVAYSTEIAALAIRSIVQSQQPVSDAAPQAHAKDRHGFANPDSVWDTRVGIVLLGDSIVLGGGVEPKDSPAEILRRVHPDLVNLAVGGTGPDKALAVLMQFGPTLKPPVVVLALNDTDFQDIGVGNGRLSSTSLPSPPPSFNPLGRGGFPVDVLLFRDLRYLLGFRGAPTLAPCLVIESNDVKSLAVAVSRIDALVQSWQGRLAVVYLPLAPRYRDQGHCDDGRKAILAAIPDAVDGVAALKSAAPMRTGNYFQASTYRDMAAIIDRAIRRAN